MDSRQVLDMITANLKYIRLKSNIALQNLSMLHKSFEGVDDGECHIALALNDGYAAIIFGSDYSKGIEISQAALERYPEYAYIKYRAEHENLIGRCYIYMAQYDAAREHLLRAESMAAGLASDSIDTRGLYADILHNLATNSHHSEEGDALTISYLTKALTLLEGTDFANRKGICYMGLGNVSTEASRHEEALAYHMKAMTYFEEAESFTNLSCVLCNIGICFTELHQFGPAEQYLMRSLDMRTRMGAYWEIANSYYNLAKLYKYQDELVRAHETLLIGRDYALVSQTKGMKLLIMEELIALATALEDTSAAQQYREQYDQIENEPAPVPQRVTSS